MKIILAGFNIDYNLLEKLRGGSVPLTPETVSAAYARISRDPRPITELRKDALEDVVRARKSNTNIVFGLGHSSVAEHAVFNFDLIGISRLAAEAIESHRLNSYTEKSQRYIKLNKDYIVPEEVEEAGLADEFREMVNAQFNAYSRLFDRLHPFFIKKSGVSADNKKESIRVEGMAKEDARYALPLATTSQLGMTINARNLEYLIQRLAGDPLAENRAVSSALHAYASEIAPSLVKYVEPKKQFDRSFIEMGVSSGLNVNVADDPVKLIKYDPEAEARVIAAMETGSLQSYETAFRRAAEMKQEERLEFFRNKLSGLSQWDRVPREFEIADFTFELIISASCFAQLKRHRMATIISYNYNPSLGITIPESIKETNSENLLEEAVEKSEEFYNKMKDVSYPAAAYALTNAHRRRVLMKMNARELYHFSRLREDKHSQWDIRYISCRVMDKLREIMPALFLLSCGKDKFPGLLETIYPDDKRQE